MNNVEQEEAKKAIDCLAREIHGIYGQHAAEAGLRTPKWEDLPEPAKQISRDIGKLTLTKMMEAHQQGVDIKTELKKIETVERPAIAIPLPKSWTPKDALDFIKGAKPEIEEFVHNTITAKRTSPVAKGLDAAVSRITEKVALDVMAENPEILAKIRQVVEAELMNFISGNEKEDV